MDVDHSVRLIYLTTPDGQNFCNGTDFRTLLRFKAEGQGDKMAEYMADIFKLQATFAKINKPIMAVAPGRSYNSGLGLLAASGLPTVCEDTRAAFNECTFGFVPHAGSTYYASRLPGDVGTFLVLTGTSITGEDAIKLGLADNLIEEPGACEREVAEIIRAADPWSLPTAEREHDAEGPGGLLRAAPYESAAARAGYSRAAEAGAEAAELRRRSRQPLDEERFVDPRTRVPDPVARADLGYKALLREHSTARAGPTGPGFFEAPA